MHRLPYFTWVFPVALLGCSSQTADTSLPDDTFDCTGCTVEVEEKPLVCANPEKRDELGAFERVEIPGITLQDFPDGPDTTLASGLAVDDLNGDGRLDIVLPHAGLPQLFMQQEDGSFVDESATRWADGIDGASAATIIDINGDGHPDVFMCAGPIPYSGEPDPLSNRLFLNDGTGILSDASADWGLTPDQFRFCYGAAFGDIDGDDDLDLALAINEFCGTPDPNGGPQDCEYILDYPSSKSLWLQENNTFEDISSRLPKEQTLASFSHVSTLLDIDGDHDLDLYLTNDAKSEISFSNNNVLFLNDGTGSFEFDQDNLFGLNIRIAGMGLGVGDLNSDERPDLLMSGTNNVYLMMSSSESWYEASQASGIRLTGNSDRIEGWGTEFADFDNDGDLDAPMMFGALFYTNDYKRMPDAFFINQGEDGFQQVAEDLGIADGGMGRGLLAVDLNGDGWLDLLKRELGGELLVYQARCGENAWSKIDLHQDGMNPQAVGARIEVTASGKRQSRWVLGGGTSLSSNGPLTQHLGLGTAEIIDKIRVTWPDGETSTFVDLPINTPLKLER